MAEERIQYRVEIDQDDLAQQLSEVRNRIESELGAMTFGATARTPGGNLFQQAASQATGGAYQEARDYMVTMRDMFSESMESAQLGYRKFTQDLQTRGLLATTSTEGAQMQSRFQGLTGVDLPQFQEYGTIRSLLGASVGMGYDWDMPYSPGQYRSLMSQRLTEKLPGFLQTTASIGSFFIPGVGPLVSAGLAFGPSIARGLAPEAGKQQDLADYIQTTTKRTLMGNMDRNEAYSAAGRIREMQFEPDLRATGVGGDEIEEAMDIFTRAGGFADVTNMQQYVDRAQETIRNFRRIQHALQTTNEEALQVMANVTRYGLGGEAGAADFVLNATAAGKTIGYTGKEMLQFAQQGAEMVRGSGVSLATGAQGAMDLLRFVRSGLSSGLFDAETIRQAGGSQQAALSMEQQAYNFTQTPTGQIINLAEAGGGSGVGPPGLLTQQAIGALGGDLSYQNIVDTLTEVQQRGQSKNPNEILMEQGAFIQERMRMSGITDITPENMAWYIEDQMGMDPSTAQLIVGQAFRSPQGIATNYQSLLWEQQKQQVQEQPGLPGRAWAAGTGALGKFWYNLGPAETIRRGVRGTTEFFQDMGQTFQEVWKGGDLFLTPMERRRQRLEVQGAVLLQDPQEIQELKNQLEVDEFSWLEMEGRVYGKAKEVAARTREELADIFDMPLGHRGGGFDEEQKDWWLQNRMGETLKRATQGEVSSAQELARIAIDSPDRFEHLKALIPEHDEEAREIYTSIQKATSTDSMRMLRRGLAVAQAKEGTKGIDAQLTTRGFTEEEVEKLSLPVKIAMSQVPDLDFTEGVREQALEYSKMQLTAQEIGTQFKRKKDWQEMKEDPSKMLEGPSDSLPAALDKVTIVLSNLHEYLKSQSAEQKDSRGGPRTLARGTR